LTLANLPPDIVRRVIRMVGQPMEKLRLISPEWNSMVVEYLSDRRNHPPLELVEFKDFPMKKTMIISTINLSTEDKDHFQPLLRDWTSNNIVPLQPDQQFSSNFQLKSMGIEKWKYLLWYFIVSINIIRLHYAIPIVFNCCVIILLITVWRVGRMKVKESRHRLNHIFSRCARINSLHLNKIRRLLFNAVVNTMGDVPIDQLIVSENNCDPDMK
ncbi:hypothetical protein PENTCL1PPCAC_1494, partial [Pristionchus entomophagus]